ncbi:hypothetical protein ACTFQF_00540 [Aliivibrio fischeri]|uniref:Uncharacterized protein n=1 Tax=Aliivibrio fischeri (strain MJ11) TaxID=388396 RepID=B5EVV1_ALIFM|nr:hypothetical protein [Aliivibrio fischeri]ACH64815.1 hypothetical protein VFMJ11_B0008 [Aliivibrio fischeri MJ11]MUK37542.1 hypothetical protein [Aliivibrio fischeri]
MNNSSWKNKEYLDQIERFAKMLSKSKAIHITFRNDEETCFMLCLMADSWNIHPHVVAANSFYDNFGRLSHTGKLLKLILTSSPLVKSVDVKHEGNWDLVSNKFKMVDNVPVPLWEPSIESTLSCTVTVTLTDDKQYTETTVLGDLDPSFRELNQAWAMRPYNQIHNHTLRQITNGKLSHIVLDMDSTEAFEEQNAANKLGNLESIVIKTSKEQNSDTHEIDANFDDDIESELIESTPQKSDDFVQLKEKQTNLLMLIVDCSIESINKQKKIEEWVKEAQAAKTNLTDIEQHEVSNLYDELVKKLQSQTVAA